MPTTRRRHAITETPQVEAALDDLREVSGSDRVELGELVILGARLKAEEIRAERTQRAALRDRLAERIRTRNLGVDPDAAARVRRSGWSRP